MKFTLALLLLVGACSHLTDEQQHLVGTWKNTEPLDATVIEFRANGTYSARLGRASKIQRDGDSTESGRWTFEHGKLCVAGVKDVEPACETVDGFDLPWKRLHLARDVYARVE